MNNVVWGMIGCGVVTEKKSGPALYKCEGSSLRAVYDCDYARACDYAKRHGVPIVYKTWEELLADEEINAVYLPTPPKFHKDYALACIAHGKVPLIEKPMANTYAECAEIIEASKAAGVPAYVAFPRRAMERNVKIKALLEAGAIGKVLTVRHTHFMPPEQSELDKSGIPWRLTPQATGGGKFMDVEVHTLDQLEYLFGPVTAACGYAQNRAGLYEVEDTVCASLCFENGVTASGTWCYVADRDEEELTIIGEKGRMVATGPYCGPLVLENEQGPQTFCFDTLEHISQPFIQTVVDELRGGRRSPADLESAANSVKVMDTILAEYRKRYRD